MSVDGQRFNREDITDSLRISLVPRVNDSFLVTGPVTRDALLSSFKYVTGSTTEINPQSSTCPQHESFSLCEVTCSVHSKFHELSDNDPWYRAAPAFQKSVFDPRTSLPSKTLGSSLIASIITE